MDDLVAEFLTEANDSLDELDVDLVTLEQNPNDQELLSKIFRLVHTVKGTCGFLGLPRLEKIAHHGENVLGRFRDGDLEVTPEYVSLIFECIDVIKDVLRALEETGTEGEGDDSALLQKLNDAYESKNNTPAPETQQPDTDDCDDTQGVSEIDAELAAAFGDPVKAEDTLVPDFDPEELPISNDINAEEDEPKKAVVDVPAPTQTLRVNVDVLENLMTMVSELVLTRNQLLQILRMYEESEFSTPLQRLNQVVSDLQEGVMQTRMQPIGNAWAKLPRIIRDLSMELDKKIDLEMHGQDTELDRQVLEMIKDPLTHMVRNSGDHGIEDPATRKAIGKPETGKITLNAYHEGGHIIIQISDDGKGLSVDKIKKKAIQNGLASAEELDQMSDMQINQFIFKAGFSTAEKVTSVSGRGVGMDVVRTNIEKIGGSIELQSQEGKGSVFTIKIPLTLAIVSALIVESSKERFAIPQIAVKELVMISDDGETCIETIKGTPVFRLRDRLLPLVSLSDLLKIRHVMPDTEDNAEHSTPKNQYIVVSHVGSYEFGIIVDRVYDTEEIVVKPVASILRYIDLFSGNTILGDGSVIMILDPNGIARATGEIEDNDIAHHVDDHPPTDALNMHDKLSLLLFKAGDQAPKAVPLSLIARLEKIDLSQIEHSAGHMMIQYRDQLMSLIPFSAHMNIDSAGEKPVLVFSSDDKKSVGIIIDEIIDIVEETVDVQIESKGSNLLGSAIINGHATDIIDVGHFLQQIDAQWFKDHGDEPFEGRRASTQKQNQEQDDAAKRILLVDDSPFFRNMLTPLLSVAGYEVTTLHSPLEALKLSEKGQDFDVIISDIEMPDMDGFEFAQQVREASHWQDIPMVALSSHATPQDIDRGLNVGFSKYVAKFDRNALLHCISQTLSEKYHNPAPHEEAS